VIPGPTPTTTPTTYKPKKKPEAKRWQQPTGSPPLNT
jgi:hypothetical protein